MIERDRRERGEPRARHHIGRIEPAAEPGLHQEDVGRPAREGDEGRRGGDLELGDRRAAIDPLAPVQGIGQSGLGDRQAVEQEALVVVHQMRRHVALHAPAGRLEHRVQHRERRALAVGAGDVHHRRQLPLGVAERCQQPLDALEREVDGLWVQALQAGQDQVTAVARHRPRSRRPAPPATARPRPRRRPSRRARAAPPRPADAGARPAARRPDRGSAAAGGA